ncbi:MAG: carboxymuconolactone decarboxylase family protein [Clostridia bacterium]|nr:MAG: carboxymuconolactone decarboxylase family protein [Clostridia bacterium]
MNGQQMSIEQILENMRQKLGTDPLPMQLLVQLLPEGVREQARSSQFVEGLETIPLKYKTLMYVAAAAAAGSELCTLTYARRAMHSGATVQEVTEALMVARFVSASIVFATAVPAMEFLVDQADQGAR